MNKEKSFDDLLESISKLVLDAKRESEKINSLESSYHYSNRVRDYLKIDGYKENKNAQKNSEIKFSNINQEEDTQNQQKSNTTIDYKALHPLIEKIFRESFEIYLNKKLKGLIEKEYNHYSSEILKSKLK